MSTPSDRSNKLPVVSPTGSQGAGGIMNNFFPNPRGPIKPMMMPQQQ